MTCPEVARLLGDATRSIEYWVHRYEHKTGRVDGGRAARTSRSAERNTVEGNQPRAARKPNVAGMRVNLWDSMTLSAGSRRPTKSNWACVNAGACSANSNFASENRGWF
jgi:hypothetical protein